MNLQVSVWSREMQLWSLLINAIVHGVQAAACLLCLSLHLITLMFETSDLTSYHIGPRFLFVFTLQQSLFMCLFACCVLSFLALSLFAILSPTSSYTVLICFSQLHCGDKCSCCLDCVHRLCFSEWMKCHIHVVSWRCWGWMVGVQRTGL